VPRDWPRLDHSHKLIVDDLAARGMTAASFPPTDAHLIVEVGRQLAKRVDVGPASGLARAWYRDQEVPAAGGLFIHMSASERLPGAIARACEGMSESARAFVMRDKAHRPAYVRHDFSDCLEPALVVIAHLPVSAPPEAAGWLQDLARAAMKAARGAQ